jgi:hypothetical protein
MKQLIIIALAFSVLGCEADYKDSTNKFSMPPELSDCKIYDLSKSNGSQITVVRCPFSSTTTVHQDGKMRRSVTIL